MSEALAGNDEAAKMDRALTRLYAQYQSSLQAAFQLKLNERKLENNLLLSKINPHFLYNTLSAIHWRLSGEEAEAIDHLVQLYRGTLGRGRDAAPLESELALIEQYVCLQRYTYSREISLSTDVTPEARMLFVPKFLLQPWWKTPSRTAARLPAPSGFRHEWRKTRCGWKCATAARP